MYICVYIYTHHVCIDILHELSHRPYCAGVEGSCQSLLASEGSCIGTLLPQHNCMSICTYVYIYVILHTLLGLGFEVYYKGLYRVYGIHTT